MSQNSRFTSLFRPARVCALALLCVPACTVKDDETPTGEPETTTGEEATTTTGEESTTTTDAMDTTTTGAMPAASCECVDADVFAKSEAGCAMSCGFILAQCQEDDCSDFTVTEEALDCALDQLISGEAGVVNYRFGHNQTDEDGAFIHVQPDRKAVMRSWNWYDLIGVESSAGVVKLKDAAYFEGCKALEDPKARFWCMTAWSDDEPDALCDVESEVEGF